MSTHFLEVVDVLDLHRRAIARYGGRAGVRDLALLQQSLEIPRVLVGGQPVWPTLAEMAAAYLFQLSRRRAFRSGNSRTALISALAFLALNGFWLSAPGRELAELAARGQAEIAVFIQHHLEAMRRTPSS